ncbi:MAG: prepilin peptidase [Deltaproteobacteria bacterium]
MSGGYEIVLWIILIAASVTDLLWGKIYNSLTLTSMGAGVLIRLALGGVSSTSVSILAISTAFILFFPLYYFKVLAAGDVKLLMAIGAWSNTDFVVRIGFTSILVGAVVGFWVLLKKKGIRKSASSVADAVNFNPKDIQKRTRMPFGPAFLCSFLFFKIAELKGWALF